MINLCWFYVFFFKRNIQYLYIYRYVIKKKYIKRKIILTRIEYKHTTKNRRIKNNMEKKKVYL